MTIADLIQALAAFPEDREIVCSHTTAEIYVRDQSGRPRKIFDFSGQHRPQLGARA